MENTGTQTHTTSKLVLNPLRADQEALLVELSETELRSVCGGFIGTNTVLTTSELQDFARRIFEFQQIEFSRRLL